MTESIGDAETLKPFKVTNDLSFSLLWQRQVLRLSDIKLPGSLVEDLCVELDETL